MKSLRGKKHAQPGTKTDVPHRQQNPSQADFDRLAKQAEPYLHKTEDELVGDMRHLFNKGKKDGTVSEEKIMQFVNALSPNLSQEQRDKMLGLINQFTKS